MQQVSALSDDPVRLLTEFNLSVYQQNKKVEGNVTDKSVIYAPFNTTLRSSEVATAIRELEKKDMRDGNILYRT